MRDEKVTVAAEPLSRFREATDELRVCDPQGRTLGYFLPPDLYQKWLYAWVKTQFEDGSGLDDVRNEPGGLTTPEAIAKLAEIAKSGRRAS